MGNQLPPWIIWHIPHARTEIPTKYRNQFLLTEEELRTEAECVADTDADTLYTRPGDNVLLFPYSRVLVDPERLRGDEEPMAAIGLGMIYQRTHDGRALRRKLTNREEAEISVLYDDHHTKLNRMTEATLERFGRCLIIDGHTYPASPLPFEDPTRGRPAVCLGTDPIHSPLSLVKSLISSLEAYKLEVGMNTPYAGALVPQLFQNDPRVMSVMIETRKDCYHENIRSAIEETIAVI